MERIDLINKVYSKIIAVFLENIPDEKSKECQEAYEKYLHKSYDLYFEECTEQEVNHVAAMCIRKEKVMNLGKNTNEKIAFLFPDSVYLSLESLSLEISSIAQNKRCGKSDNVTKTREEYSLELSKLYDSVSELFRYSADRLYSEGLADLEYIFGDGSVSSFRNSS